MTAQRQAQLYYSRQRTKTLRRTEPRLFQTHSVGVGQSSQSGIFTNDQLVAPVTVLTKVDLSQSGSIWNISGAVGVSSSGSGVTINMHGSTFNISGSGNWSLVVAMRPGDGSMRVWNQYGLIAANNNIQYPASRFAVPDSGAAAGVNILEPLRIYAMQRPRDYGEASINDPLPQSDELLFNSTLIGFMQGFETPFLEG